ncbi:Transcriptional regulator, LacI family [Mesorhizobium plurifarium]|uniref:Transcriptional regulator, LacI family n=1 Tax=Mesorhizobium plurifarium TaxID=69974 RepID=A0A090DAN4_MESPL|nr:Transcriptional regulator, LacI family [Mesorhizobium plurifarium]CDX37959.1 Transcriptional regulator, LacI family [Mesorhizobium sp. ORS 3359]
MARRPTITDLAERAGVSVSTIDRVLNGRHPVREETARRVYEAAREIGYHAAGLIRQRIERDLRPIRFGFLLLKEEQAFYRAFALQLTRAVEETPGVRGIVHIEFVRSQTPSDFVKALETVATRADVIGMASLDHHLVTRAVETLKASGKAVFSLLSDFAQGVRHTYVGVNNMKAGRTAAWLISRTAPQVGKVAVFVGSHRWHGHELRETGFRSYFREHAPQFHVLDTLVNLDTKEVTHEATVTLVERYPDLAGFYVAGGGFEGAIAALRELDLARPPSVVVNELVPETTDALQEHLVVGVIATPLEQLCRALIDLMVRTLQAGPLETSGQLFLPFTLHVPESV